MLNFVLARHAYEGLSKVAILLVFKHNAAIQTKAFDYDFETRTDAERNAREFNGIKKEASNADDGTPETLESFLSNTLCMVPDTSP